MIVELHIIQNFAPSNLNRDDTNAPKDCEFGGYRRARISSQCIKRSVRTHAAFKDAVQVAGGDIAWRTKRIMGKLAEILEKEHGKSPENARIVAERAVEVFGVLRDDKSPEKTKILLYLGENEIRDVIKVVLEHWEAFLSAPTSASDEIVAGKKGKGKKKVSSDISPALASLQKKLHGVVSPERLKTGAYAADIALFGRMVADNSIKNMGVDAACQVAHAISTHKVEMEMDYFTAVDDLLPGEETGSDMIGIVEFNSSCFYRYSLVNVGKLQENLGPDKDLLRGTVRGFLEASVKAIPTGKQNSMAAQNPACYARVLVRKDGFPWSLTNAFQRPVRPTAEASLEERSIAALQDYFDRLGLVYGKESIVCDATLNLHDPDSPSLQGVLDQVTAVLQKHQS